MALYDVRSPRNDRNGSTSAFKWKYEDDIRIFDKIETEALKWLIICTVALLIRCVKKKKRLY